MAIRPMPDDFAPALSVHKGKIIYQRSVDVMVNGAVQPMAFETGYALDADSPERREALRLEIWTALEHARNGDGHHIKHLSRDRHKGHPVSVPQFTPKPQPKE